jgi:hypothetical protein
VTRSTLPFALALTASASLLLTACGGTSSDNSDKIQPAATTGTPTATSASPSATPTQAADPNAPKFDLPSDVHVNFENFDTTNPTNGDVLQTAKYAMTALLEAEALGQTKETANFKRYWTGLPGAAFADTIIARIKSGKLITGTYRYYAPSVTTGDGGTPVVAFCEDQRKAYDKDAKTGAAAVTTPSLSDFRSWSLAMAKGTDGEWRVGNYSRVTGDKKCEVA